MRYLLIVAVLGILPAIAEAQITDGYRENYAARRTALQQCRQEHGITTALPPEEPAADPFIPIPELNRMVEECQRQPARQAERHAAVSPAARMEVRTPAQPRQGGAHAERPPAVRVPDNHPAPEATQAPAAVTVPATADPEISRRLEALTQSVERLRDAQAAATRQDPQPPPREPSGPEEVAPAKQAPPIVENRPVAGYRQMPAIPPLPGAGARSSGLPILPAPDHTVGYVDFMPTGWDRAVGRAIKLVDGVRRWSPINPSVMEPLCYMAVQLEGEDVRMVQSGHLLVAYAATPNGHRPVAVLPPGGSAYITARSPRPQHFRFRCYVPTGARIAAAPESVSIVDGRPVRLATDEVLELFLEGNYEQVPGEVRIQRFHLEEVRPR